MRHLDLFSGIGGFALAVDWAFPEAEHIFCEIEPFCQKVLKKHWPQSKIYSDVKTLKTDKLGRIDLLTGGFPCQPFSVAGKRGAQNDDRYLWPAMLKIIKECRPRWIIGENVAGIINLALEQVCLDLESEEYEVWPIVIPACAVNAPHRRDRVWIIAHDRSKRVERIGKKQIQRKPILQRGKNERRIEININRPNLYPSELCRSRNGISKRLDSCGNAIVPQVAYEIIKNIKITNK